MSNRYITGSDRATAKNNNGVFFAPTGVGKGVTIEHLANDVLLLNANGTRIFVVVAHRILLAQSMAERVVDYLIANSANLSSLTRMTIHSGTPEELGGTDPIIKNLIASSPEVNPKTPQDIGVEIKKAEHLKHDILINVTYHSLSLLTEALAAVAMTVACSAQDEIHHIPSQELWRTSSKELIFLSTRYYGFTATPGKYREWLEELFGGCIYEMDIATAIKYGLISTPRWIITDINGPRQFNFTRGVASAFQYQQNSLPKLPTKMLVHCRDSKDVTTLSNKKTGKDLWDLKIKYPDLMIAEVSSFGGHKIDGKTIKDRLKWLRIINAHDGQMITLHIDICNSGIDVPGFNYGLWTYVPGSESYTIQGNGRSGRLHDDDRAGLNEGILSTIDTSNWTKPYNYVGVLCWTDSFNVQSLADLIVKSKEFGFDPDEALHVDPEGMEKSDPWEGQHGTKNPNAQSALQVAITTIIEAEKTLARLTIALNVDPADAWRAIMESTNG